MKIKTNQRKSNKGAALFIAVIFLGFIFTITVLVVKIQLKELQFGSLEESSNMAIFAADAGLERALYNIYQETGLPPDTCTTTGCFIPGPGITPPYLQLENGASFHVTVPNGSSSPVVIDPTTEYIVLRSIGRFHNTERSLELNLYIKKPGP
jgi:Tfp pilus assembly protein PilX